MSITQTDRSQRPTLVVIESPSRGRPAEWIPRPLAWFARYWLQLNYREYAIRCMADSLSRGEAPLAFHLLYAIAGLFREGREGLPASEAWSGTAQKRVIYCDLGISEEMQTAIAGRPRGQLLEYRYLLREATEIPRCHACKNVLPPEASRCQMCQTWQRSARQSQHKI
jgi:hypothetical protein